jgi:REP element-mobilizing transposase RayT
MTPPRQVLPGTTYLVTRRCAERRFFLRPSNLTNQVFLYVLALAARRFGVQVHAFCAMSNHFHLLVTDPDARLPDFERYLNSLLARALNCALGRWEHFWAPNSYSAVALRTPQDVLNKAGYVLANPVAAGLVPQARQWPGPWSAPEQIGAIAVPVQRPAIFFSPKGYAPATASLQLVAPPGFASARRSGRRSSLISPRVKQRRLSVAASSSASKGCWHTTRWDTPLPTSRGA